MEEQNNNIIISQVIVLTATQRAKHKYYLKNKDKLQKRKTELNKMYYENNPDYREMVKHRII